LQLAKGLCSLSTDGLEALNRPNDLSEFLFVSFADIIKWFSQCWGNQAILIVLAS